ncbi:hypothetical protein P7K49_029068 [Saguinus oedipus]|uniref:Uncharacterized protein n=1 Tax=Saguinus oedipus TaxID=9490 RepID=A0ABQ9U669_SAGOE|nr:hypothetical protein P7K49_029068 [Saguinus oedipus]
MSKVMDQELQDEEGRDEGRRNSKGRKEKGSNTRVQGATEERVEEEKSLEYIWRKQTEGKDISDYTEGQAMTTKKCKNYRQRLVEIFAVYMTGKELIILQIDKKKTKSGRAVQQEIKSESHSKEVMESLGLIGMELSSNHQGNKKLQLVTMCKKEKKHDKVCLLSALELADLDKLDSNSGYGLGQVPLPSLKEYQPPEAVRRME